MPSRSSQLRSVLYNFAPLAFPLPKSRLSGTARQKAQSPGRWKKRKCDGWNLIQRRRPRAAGANTARAIPFHSMAAQVSDQRVRMPRPPPNTHLSLHRLINIRTHGSVGKKKQPLRVCQFGRSGALEPCDATERFFTTNYIRS